MDFTSAIKVLGIESDNVTPESVKKAYRKLAMQYHPDKTGKNDGAMFIKVTVAYEFIKSNNFSDQKELFRETEDELNTRIEAIRMAFRKVKEEYSQEHVNFFNKMVDEIVDALDSYDSHKKLREGINQEIPVIVDKGINRIIIWFNEKIQAIAESYEDWICGFLKSSYTELKEKELSGWYKSAYFYKHIGFSLLFVIFVWLLIVESNLDSEYYLFSGIPLIFGILLYRKNVNKKYTLTRQEVGLDTSQFRINASDLFLKHDGSASMLESARNYGAVGAMIGMIGGPLGAAIGGAIGGFLGSLFGESVDELREKFANQLEPKIDEVEQQLLQRLDEYIPEIEEEIIKSIKSNYVQNKDAVVKLLLKS